MQTLLNTPHKLTWATILLISIITILAPSKTVDIQMHDTYIVMALLHLGIAFSIILGFIGGVYWLFRKKKLIQWMTFTHLGITLFSFLSISIIALFYQNFARSNPDFFRIINQLLLTLIPIVLFIQILFLINLIISSIRNKAKQ